MSGPSFKLLLQFQDCRGPGRTMKTVQSLMLFQKKLTRLTENILKITSGYVGKIIMSIVLAVALRIV